MDDDILSKVVEVEREVQQRIEVEKKVSEEWLEKVKKDAGERIIAEEEGLKNALHEAVTRARERSGEKAAAIIHDAKETAGSIEKISDDILNKIILQHISKILPGQ